MQRMLLVVESDDQTREAIASHLRTEGYFVLALADGKMAVEVTRLNPVSLVLLDLALSRRDGLDVYQQLRSRPETEHVPILMLLAYEREIFQVTRPQTGLDDYITKPLDRDELRARVRTLLRGSRQRLVKASPDMEIDHEDDQVFMVDDLCIDTARRSVTKRDRPIDLRTMLLFDLLVYLVRHRGLVLTRDRLLMGVWSYDRASHSRTVDVHVRWLRQKIEDDPDNPQLILTVRGLGYRFKE